MKSRYGFTLIELLIAVVISAIAMFALVPPFLAEGNLFREGKRQTEAQRDAQMVLRAMARAGRECQAYNVPPPPPVSGATVLSFNGCPPPDISRCFVGGSAFLSGQMVERTPNCQTTPTQRVLIDSVRSKVASFTFTPVTSKLVLIHLEVTHQLRTTDTRTRTEVLETELFLRNAT